MYGEDSEWCMRIRRAGGRIVYHPLAVVYHVGNASSDIEWTQEERLRLCHRGGLLAYAKLHGRLAGAAYHAARIFGTSVRWAMYALLSTAVKNPYYQHQRRHYGVLARIYLGETVRRRGTDARSDAASSQPRPAARGVAVGAD